MKTRLNIENITKPRCNGKKKNGANIILINLVYTYFYE